MPWIYYFVNAMLAIQLLSLLAQMVHARRSHARFRATLQDWAKAKIPPAP